MENVYYVNRLNISVAQQRRTMQRLLGRQVTLLQELSVATVCGRQVDVRHVREPRELCHLLLSLPLLPGCTIQCHLMSVQREVTAWVGHFGELVLLPVRMNVCRQNLVDLGQHLQREAQRQNLQARLNRLASDSPSTESTDDGGQDDSDDDDDDELRE